MMMMTTATRAAMVMTKRWEGRAGTAGALAQRRARGRSKSNFISDPSPPPPSADGQVGMVMTTRTNLPSWQRAFWQPQQAS